MTETRTWTVSECLEQIEALEAKRSALVDVPVRGSVGNTTIDLSDKPGSIADELALWRVRLAAARSPSRMAERPRWGCG